MTQGRQMAPGITTIRSRIRIPNTIPSTIPSTIRTTGPSVCKILLSPVVLRTPPDRSLN
jgi:hypothetical protein